MSRELQCEWALVTGPTQEPLSDLDLVKLQTSITQTDEDRLLHQYVKAARQAAETHLNTALMTQTWILHVECFADVIWLPMASPLQNSASPTDTRPVVQYYDVDGVLQTLATSYYEVDTVSSPGRILRAPNQTYPSVQSDRQMPVRITYVCGYTADDLVPELIKQGMLLYIAGCDGDRVGEADKLAAHRCWDLVGRVSWRPPEWRY